LQNAATGEGQHNNTQRTLFSQGVSPMDGFASKVRYSLAFLGSSALAASVTTASLSPISTLDDRRAV
jgi:hypothetical protein